jgi:hypothetical protein
MASDIEAVETIEPDQLIPGRRVSRRGSLRPALRMMILTGLSSSVGIGGPGEGLGVLIGFDEEAVNSGLQIDDACEDTRFEPLPGHGLCGCGTDGS